MAISVVVRAPGLAGGGGGGASINLIAVTPGNGTATLNWAESGTVDSVNIYRDGQLFDSVTGGLETYTSATMPDGLYAWQLKPVSGGVEGTGSTVLNAGNMSGDVWVDAVNGNDVNAGTSPATAVKTLNEAGSRVNAAGMRVVVRGGLYSEYNSRISGSIIGNPPLSTFTQNGTPGSPCELFSFPGENVIIDGSSILVEDLTSNNDPEVPELLHIGGSNWVVSGWPGPANDPMKYAIELRNSAGGGFRTRLTDNVKVFYVNSHAHEGSAFNVQTSDSGEIGFCYGWDVYSTFNDGETADGVAVGNGTGWVIHDSLFAWCGDDGIDVLISENCEVYNCLVYKSGFFTDGSPGLGNGNGIKMAHATNPNSGNYIHNCITVGCRNTGLDFNDGGATCESSTDIGSRWGAHVGSVPSDGNYFIREVVCHNNITADFEDNGGTPGLEKYNSWNDPPGITVTNGDFENLTFNEGWRSWQQAVDAGFAKLASTSDMKGAGEQGQDLGYEGTADGQQSGGGGTPNLGDNVFGGYFVGIIDTTVGNIDANDAYQTGARYMLIVAPKSLEVTSNGNEWHTTGIDFNAAKTRWDGLSATEAMVAAGAAFQAAAYVDSLSFPSDGGSQWYLPAVDELELVYRNLKPNTTNNSTGSDTAAFPGTITHGVNPSSDPQGSAYASNDPAQTAVTSFQEGNAQALTTTPGVQSHMTATWANTINAWVQDVNDGFIFDLDQTNSGNLTIRPVRRIPL